MGFISLFGWPALIQGLAARGALFSAGLVRTGSYQSTLWHEWRGHVLWYSCNLCHANMTLFPNVPQ